MAQTILENESTVDYPGNAVELSLLLL